jgi:predicted secreted hydrolase
VRSRSLGGRIAAAAIGRLVVVAIAPVAVLVTVAGIALAQTEPAVHPVHLPRDHGAHPGFEVEWWYTAGTVADHRGRRYFWFATVWSTGMGQIARVNVVDLRADRIVLSREYLSGTPLTSGQTRMSVGGFQLGWRPTGKWGRWSIDAPSTGGTLKLDLVPRIGYVLNGHHGIIQQGPGGPSAYYSEPRIAARGVLDLHGRRIAVSGEGWLDHQWGNFIADVGSLRWNWFACQFSDGRDLMLYQFLNAADRPSGVQAGTLVDPPHTVRHLDHFTIRPLRPDIRPAGAVTSYPLRWRLAVRSAGIGITLRALARHQFIVNTMVPSFWEGAATITRGSPGRCIVESSRQPTDF